MRIIGGQFRGRPLRQPKFKPTRPTTDIAKEGLFNILSNRFNFDKVSFLDLFSGTELYPMSLPHEDAKILQASNGIDPA